MRMCWSPCQLSVCGSYRSRYEGLPLAWFVGTNKLLHMY
jgi:hypothetical protein